MHLTKFLDTLIKNNVKVTGIPVSDFGMNSTIWMIIKIF